MARDYSGLTREQLEARLNAAEDVCALTGWTASTTGTAREGALYELWKLWGNEFGGPTGREGNEHLTDELIEELAEQRRAIRDATLKRLPIEVVQDI